MAFTVDKIYTNDTWTTSSPVADYVPIHWLTATYGLMAFIAGLGNIAVVVTFLVKRKLLEKNFNVLILNLAVADMCVGIFDLPFLVGVYYLMIEYAFRDHIS